MPWSGPALGWDWESTRPHTSQPRVTTGPRVPVGCGFWWPRPQTKPRLSPFWAPANSWGVLARARSRSLQFPWASAAGKPAVPGSGQTCAMSEKAGSQSGGSPDASGVTVSDIQELIRRKEEIEAQIKANYEVLESVSVGTGLPGGLGGAATHSRPGPQTGQWGK